LAAVLGPSLSTTIIVIGATVWARYARVVRAEVMSLRERDFITAARALGAFDGRIIWKHVVPNVLTSVIVLASLQVGSIIILESAQDVRVFLGGIVTETNTFSPIPTGIDDWVVVRDLADAEAGGALEAFAQEAAARGDELAFGLYAFAMPAGVTTRAAWTGLRDELLGMLEAAMPVDTVLLPLHGAMV
ncbi:MAG: M81 family metallopeptidase, partial [Candidatus Binatia bacterium]